VTEVVIGNFMWKTGFTDS